MPSPPPEDSFSGSLPSPPSGDWSKGTDHLWRNLQGINEWTRFADAKAVAVLTANGVLGTVALGVVKDHWKDLPNNLIINGLAYLGGMFLIVSSFVCVKCLLPDRRVRGGTRSLLYFDHIALRDQEQYLQESGALHDDDRAFREVGKQVWANARVARKKYREVYWAILLTGGSLACALAAWIVVFLNR